MFRVVIHPRMQPSRIVDDQVPAEPVPKSSKPSIFDRPRCEFCLEPFTRQGVDDLFQHTSKQEVQTFLSSLTRKNSYFHQTHLRRQFQHTNTLCISRIVNSWPAYDGQPYICANCWMTVRSMLLAFDEDGRVMSFGPDDDTGKFLQL